MVMRLVKKNSFLSLASDLGTRFRTLRHILLIDAVQLPDSHLFMSETHSYYVGIALFNYHQNSLHARVLKPQNICKITYKTIICKKGQPNS